MIFFTILNKMKMDLSKLINYEINAIIGKQKAQVSSGKNTHFTVKKQIKHVSGSDVTINT